MSALPLPSPDIEKLASQYVSSILRKYEAGSFALFGNGETVYAGLIEDLEVFGDSVLVRVIKEVSPPHKSLIEPLTLRSRLGVLRLDPKIELKERNLFYARLHDYRLERLSDDEQRYLISKNKF